MKNLMIFILVAGCLQASAQYQIIERDVPESNKYMIQQAGLAQEKSVNQLYASWGLMAGATGLQLVQAIRFSNDEPALRAIPAFSTILGLASVGLRVSSAIQLKRSGAYLQAYASGIIITF